LALIITDRDLRLIRDIALSHVLSRDQVLGLGYFGSVSRANRRLRSLCEVGFLRSLAIPFEHQRLYVAGSKAAAVVGERIALLLENRASSPRFLQHAHAVTDVRMALQKLSQGGWRFEQQIRDAYSWAGRPWELRPDGLFMTCNCVKFVEVDLGHVSLLKFSRKLRSYAGYVASGRFRDVYGENEAETLVVTTGQLRRNHLAKDSPAPKGIVYRFQTFEELGITLPGGWS
jgi:hypothetical protein